MPRHMGGGVIPSRKNNGWGVGGVPPSPRVRETVPFLQCQNFQFVWSYRRKNEKLPDFWERERNAQTGPEGGGGTPLLPRHMGRGVILSGKNKGWGVGGVPPSPPFLQGTAKGALF